ncbi:T9SS type A sorting domain-containing protein, partial [Biomphalaria glabrata]
SCGALPAGSSCSLRPVACDQDPCKVQECISFPMADCVPNYCGGCFADYYFNGQLVDPYMCTNIII